MLFTAEDRVLQLAYTRGTTLYTAMLPGLINLPGAMYAPKRTVAIGLIWPSPFWLWFIAAMFFTMSLEDSFAYGKHI